MSEDFLRRWSRRKQAAQDGKAAESSEDVSRQDAERSPQGSQAEARELPQPASAASADASDFDLTKLPSIESITAATDITPFLQRGVPAALTREALRRAWSADPAIRDFVGLAENSWDFTAQNSIPGFGSLNATEAQNLLARFLDRDTDDAAREEPQPQVPATVAEAENKQDETPVEAATEDNPRDAAQDIALLHCGDEEADSCAAQPNDRLHNVAPRRGHGGALPQ